jgi:hypothetical protein
MWLRHRILVQWAHEACRDPDRLTFDPDPAGRSGRSVRIVGYSILARSLLVVILVREGSRLFAATAWPANQRDWQMYRAGVSDDAP